MFESTSYSFSLYSLPTAFAALGILGLGIAVLIQERVSRVSASFFLLALSVSTWLFSFSVAYSSADVVTAGFWIRVAYIGVPFIAPATYQFSLDVLRKYESYRIWAISAWVAAAAFSGLLVFTDLIIEGVTRYWWGFYPRYSLAGLVFIAYFSAVLVASMFHYMAEYRAARAGTVVRQRTRALILAFAVGYMGIFDFVPVFGIPLYPFGFLAIGGFVVLCGRAIWVYRLVDITPAFAAKEILATMTDALLVFDSEGLVRLANDAAALLFGTPRDTLIGAPVTDALPDAFFASQVSRLLGTGQVSDHELPYETAEGTVRSLSISTSAMHDSRGRHNATVLLARDITERKIFEAELEHRSLHDPLTNLPNRALFIETLAHTMKRSQNSASQAHLAVLFIDIDDFKRVNDSMGHVEGDRVIGVAARLLAGCLKPGNTLARMAADEFAILVEDVGGSEQALELADEIQEAFKTPMLTGPRGVPALQSGMLSPDIFVSVSVGVAVWQGSGGNSPEDLLRSADIAMHEAKSRGKAQCALYNSGMDARAKQRLRHESELRRAFEHSELSVYYQPLVNIRGGGIYGFEALLRWIHPKRGVISPAEFIPLAEETGLIVPIGRWVLEQACRQVRVWHAREPQRPLLLSVNLSPRQFKNPFLVDEISQCLKTTGFPPYQLQLEITESTGFEEMASANATLWRLKDLGVRIALDDFGTGYSALGYLKHYPVDTIKLDRSFVQGLGHNSQDTAIIHAVVAFARALSLSITAEGIETAEQLDHLNRLGCEYGQGYYFARPVPADRAAAMLSASTSSGDLSLLATVPGAVSPPLP